MDKIMMLSVFLCAVTLHFTAASDPIEGGCPYGWSYRDGACYRVVDVDTPKWQDAQARCRQIGGRLVKITSEEENQYVLELAQKYAPNLRKLWVGLERDCGNNMFYWEDTTAVEYSNWLEGQPDNFDDEENCGHMYTTGDRAGQWNDRPCNSPDEGLAFMCQKECGPGWSYYGGNCYRIESDNEGWRDAAEKCAEQGAELVKIENRKKNNFLAAIGAWFAQGKYRMWIGMNRDCEDDLRWIDGTTPRYTNWREGQPDNWGDNEDCVHMYLSGDYPQEWNDNTCMLDDPSEAAFACQKVDSKIKKFKKT